MNDPLPFDVMARLTQDFGNRADAVAALLLTHRRIGSEEYVGDRLVRCIVHASHGDEQRAHQLIDLERQDYRDVITAGEYDDAMRHIRDLRVSFLIDSPEKFWIGEVSCMMASRGCRLTSLQTSAATIGPFEFTSDFGEGIATFMGPKGRIDIEKKDRKWMLSGNDRELEIHNLNHAFDDERVFCDAVSAYLLSNIAVNAANEANNDLRGSP